MGHALPQHLKALLEAGSTSETNEPYVNVYHTRISVDVYQKHLVVKGPPKRGFFR